MKAIKEEVNLHLTDYGARAMHNGMQVAYLNCYGMSFIGGLGRALAYATDEGYQKQGIMVNLLKLFLENNKGDYHAVAWVDNYASRKVLERNGFVLVAQDDSKVYYQYTR